MITADAKIVVAEYMQGQQAGGDTGDPAMTIAVPRKQNRTDYLFHAPTNYESTFVNVTAPVGASITLDGMPLPAPTPIGNTGYGVARVELSNAGDGTHALAGDQKFGIQVYGYGQYTSDFPAAAMIAPGAERARTPTCCRRCSPRGPSRPRYAGMSIPTSGSSQVTPRPA